MSLPRSWHAEAFNPVPESPNRIHSDEIARAYGFRGALVPGVIVSAYLLHPAAEAWGRDWVERGQAHAVVHSPVYDGERFDVRVEDARADAYHASLIDVRDAVCATAAVSLPSALPDPPVRRGDPLLHREDERPVASRAVMERLRDTGLRAMPARWDRSAEITHYLRDEDQLASVYRDEGLANPAFVLGLTNWVLGQNLRMDAWLHLQTDSQHFRAIEPGSELLVEARIEDLFEKKGHEFADVAVGIFRRSDDAPVASVELRAIYELRPPTSQPGAPRRGKPRGS